MKAKGSTSLYEVLKSASRPAGDPAASGSPAPAAPTPDAAAPQVSLQERLAAYKAAKLAAATSPAVEPAPEAPAAVAVAEPPPPAPKPAPALVAPPPAPAPEPAPSLEAVEAPTVDGPGERVLRLTYNSFAFAGLVALGLLFLAYALGVRSGRRGAAAEAAAEPVPAARASAPVPPPPPPPPPPVRIHTVWLGEWKYGAPSERMKAEDAVRQLKAALDKAGHKGARSMQVRRGSELRLGLHIDEVADPAAADARARLASLRKFRFGSQTPFAQASYVELPK